MIKLKNGSTIKAFESTSSIRSKRSELISFYCYNCNCVHEDYPIKSMMIISDDLAMCKESFEKVLEPYLSKRGEEYE
jgi:hypothetical protein